MQAGLQWHSFLGLRFCHFRRGGGSCLSPEIFPAAHHRAGADAVCNVHSAETSGQGEPSTQPSPATWGVGGEPQSPFCRMECLAAQRAARATSYCFKAVRSSRGELVAVGFGVCCLQRGRGAGSEPGASPSLTVRVWAWARVLGIWAALVQNSVSSMLFSAQRGEGCVCVKEFTKTQGRGTGWLGDVPLLCLLNLRQCECIIHSKNEQKVITQIYFSLSCLHPRKKMWKESDSPECLIIALSDFRQAT